MIANMLDDMEHDRLTKSFNLRVMDFDDSQREVAELDVGRIQRFTDGNIRGGRAEKEKERDAQMRRALASLREMLANDPEYAALYDGAMTTLRDAENATEQALDVAMERQRVADEALADIRDRALTLEDGRRVYRDEGGAFRLEDGSAADFEDDAAAQERWHPSMTPWAISAEYPIMSRAVRATSNSSIVVLHF